VTSPSALAALRRVRVGSLNPPKLEGVRAALAAFAPDVAIEAVAVESGVPDQPLGFAEILAGARQRAQAARQGAPCDLSVGYEDGLVELPGHPGRWFNVGCAALSDGRRLSLGLSSGFAYPPACAREAATGRRPIGDLFDRLWSDHRGSGDGVPSGLSLGNVGKLTLAVLTRAEYTRHAVLCALPPFLHPDLYGAPGAPS
jgi:inosine/xanthosine triphosphatase